MDARKQIFIDRLRRLSKTGVKRIRDNVDNICLDEYNYDETTKRFCPIAIGLWLDLSINNPTNEKVTQKISEFFQPPNALKGLKGEFYTSNRREDLKSVCEEVLANWT